MNGGETGKTIGMAADGNLLIAHRFILNYKAPCILRGVFCVSKNELCDLSKNASKIWLQ